MGELARLLEMRRSGFRVMFGERGFEQVAERLALVLPDDDEAPRCQLAMVRRARRDGQDGVELGRRRAGRDHFARAARAAALEIRDKR